MAKIDFCNTQFISKLKDLNLEEKEINKIADDIFRQTMKEKKFAATQADLKSRMAKFIEEKQIDLFVKQRNKLQSSIKAANAVKNQSLSGVGSMRQALEEYAGGSSNKGSANSSIVNSEAIRKEYNSEVTRIFNDFRGAMAEEEFILVSSSTNNEFNARMFEAAQAIRSGVGVTGFSPIELKAGQFIENLRNFTAERKKISDPNFVENVDYQFRQNFKKENVLLSTEDEFISEMLETTDADKMFPDDFVEIKALVNKERKIVFDTKNTIKSLSKDLGVARKSIKVMEGSAKEIGDKFLELKQVKDKTAIKAESINKEIGEIADLVKSTSSEIKSLQAKLKEAGPDLNVKKQIEDLRATKKKLEGDIDNKKTELNKIKDELKIDSSRADEAEARYNKKLKDIDKKTKEIEDIKKTRSEKKKRLNEITDTIGRTKKVAEKTPIKVDKVEFAKQQFKALYNAFFEDDLTNYERAYSSLIPSVHAKSRKLVYKNNEARVRVMEKYGHSGNPIQLAIHSARRDSADFTIETLFGKDIRSFVKTYANALEIKDPNIKKSSQESLNNLAGDIVAAIRGEAPKHGNFESQIKILKNLSSAFKLWNAAKNSFPELLNIAAIRKIGTGENLFKKAAQSVNDYFKLLPAKNRAQAAKDIGIYLDMTREEFLNNHQHNSNNPGWSDKLAEFTYKWSFLENHAESNRMAGIIGFSIDAGKSADLKFGDLGQEMKKMLDSAGIDADDWDIIRSNSMIRNGQKVLNLNTKSFHGRELDAVIKARRLAIYFSDFASSQKTLQNRLLINKISNMGQIPVPASFKKIPGASDFLKSDTIYVGKGFAELFFQFKSFLLRAQSNLNSMATFGTELSGRNLYDTAAESLLNIKGHGFIKAAKLNKLPNVKFLSSYMIASMLMVQMVENATEISLGQEPSVPSDPEQIRKLISKAGSGLFFMDMFKERYGESSLFDNIINLSPALGFAKDAVGAGWYLGKSGVQYVAGEDDEDINKSLKKSLDSAMNLQPNQFMYRQAVNWLLYNDIYNEIDPSYQRKQERDWRKKVGIINEERQAIRRPYE